MITASMVKELRELTGAGMLDCKKALEESNGDMEAAKDWLREKGISKAAKKSSRIAAEGLAYAKIDGNVAIILEVNSETDFVAKNEEFISMVNMIADSLINSNVNSLEDALNLEVDGKNINDLIIDKTAKIGEKLSFRRFERIIKDDNQVFGTYSHMGGRIVTLVLLDNNNEVAKDIAMHVAAMNPLYLNKDVVPSDALDRERNVLKEQATNEGLDPNKLDMIVNGRINKYYEDVCLIDQNFIKENKMKISTYLNNNKTDIIKFIRYEVGEGLEKRADDFQAEVMKQING